jgi:hypothetical protein
VSDELVLRGWAVKESTVENRPVLHITRSGQRRQVRVSAKQSGAWQTSMKYGMEAAAPEMKGRFWILVDLGQPKPEFFVAPEDWMVENIYRVHRQFLAEHQGRRPKSPDSTHHAIRRDRVEEWRERWDLLETAAP